MDYQEIRTAVCGHRRGQPDPYFIINSGACFPTSSLGLLDAGLASTPRQGMGVHAVVFHLTSPFLKKSMFFRDYFALKF